MNDNDNNTSNNGNSNWTEVSFHNNNNHPYQQNNDSDKNKCYSFINEMCETHIFVFDQLFKELWCTQRLRFIS